MQVPPPARSAIPATGCYVPTAGCDVPTMCLELHLTLAVSTRGPSPTDTRAAPGPRRPPQWPLPAEPVLWGRLVAHEGQLRPGRLGGGVGSLEDIL